VDKSVTFVDKCTINWLRRRLRRAKARVESERVTIVLARDRMRYWSRIVHALEDRLESKEQGQLELDLVNGSNRPLDP